MEEREQLIKQLAEVELPQHVGIIMDGNGRWAKKRLLPRSAGHRAGVGVLEKIGKFARDCGVRYITFYAFSTENWKRPQAEISELMRLLHKFLSDAHKYERENIRLRFIGDRTLLTPELQLLMEQAETNSAQNTGLTLLLALNYGSKNEIVRVVNRLVEQAGTGAPMPPVTEEQFDALLDTGDAPPCDLVIRPSGEQRLSNFLLWQAAYAELLFCDILWPDYTEAHFAQALLEYSQRQRRFGGI